MLVRLFYGPLNPHLGHLYRRPNLRHFPSRLIWMSPQFGHRNFVDSLPGGMGFPQLVHVTRDNFSDITGHFFAVHIVRVPYICYAQKFGFKLPKAIHSV
jgi:hypothetical protein